MRRPRGTRDSFKNLLGQHPDVELFIAKLTSDARMQRLTMRHIHEMGLMELKAKGLGEEVYPFNDTSKGY